jgi:DNA ligase-1
MIKPMLLHKANNANSDDSYICELKLDGIRLILSCRWPDPMMDTSCLDRFPELATLDLPPDTIVDGEIIVTDENGHPQTLKWS